jgi:hypothetical protein
MPVAGEIHEGVVGSRVEAVIGSALNRELRNLTFRAGMQLKKGIQEGKIIFRADSGHKASVGSLTESPREPFGGFIVMLAVS